jgi:hypothetical protein
LDAQGNTQPHWNFDGHAVVRLPPGMASYILDPSYGAAFATELAWEAAAVEEYLYFYSNAAPQLVPNTAAAKDCTFVSAPFAFVP